MTDAIGNILSNKQSREPAEFSTIKTFVLEHFGVTPALALRNNSIIISMPSSASAGSLKLVLHELQDQLKTPRQLVIRIV